MKLHIRGFAVNKIRYILKLNNVRMTNDAYEEIDKKLKTAYSDAKKRKIKKRLSVLGVVLACAFVLLLSVFLVVKAVERFSDKGGHIVIDPDPSSYTTYETTSFVDPVPDDGYLYIKPLYEGNWDYEFLKAVTKVMKLSDGGALVVNGDLSSLYSYFNVSELSPIELCRTMTSFYDASQSLDVIYPANNQQPFYTDARRDLVDELLTTYSFEKDNIYTYEFIALTAKHGTFEYLLTFTGYVDGRNTGVYPYLSSSLTGLSGEALIYNADGETVGRVYKGEVIIDKVKIQTLKASIYKIRFENGIPVIYSRKAVSGNLLNSAEGEAAFGSTPFGLNFENDGSLPSYKKQLKSAILKYSSDTAISFGKAENNMKNEVSQGGGTVYLYSAPTGDDAASKTSRGTVSDIINYFNMQWFIPMFENDTMTVEKTVYGVGISTNEGSVPVFDETFSMLYLIGDRSGNFADYITREPKRLYYNGALHDRPYFENIYDFDELTLLKITCKSGQMTCEAVNPDSLPGPVLKSGRNLDLPGFDFTLPVILPSNYTYKYTTTQETKPLSRWLLPYVDEGLSYYLSNELLANLGITAVSVGRLAQSYDSSYSLSEYTLFPRTLSFVRTETTPVYEKVGDKTYRYDIVTAYQRSGLYLADADGKICALVSDNGFCYYPFDSCERPEFKITVVSTVDGEFIYMGSGRGMTAKNTVEGLLNYEMTECGLYLGTLIDALENVSYLSYLPIITVRQEGAETVFEFYSTAKLPTSTYPITLYGEKIYHCSNGITRWVDDIGVHWEFEDENVLKQSYTATFITFYDENTATLLVINNGGFEYRENVDETWYETVDLPQIIVYD